MTRIIVTDGETRTALATVRSLGRAGHEVCTVAGRPDALAAASRHARRHVVLPRAEQDPEAYAGAVAALADQWPADLVLPVTDASMNALLGLGLNERPWRLVAPPREAYEGLSDKAGLLDRARAAGVTVPRTVLARAPAELAAAAGKVGYPCVLKPHRSVVREGGQLRRFYVSYADDPSALAALSDASALPAYPVLVQERIVGPGEGAFFLMDHGRTVAAFAHRRIREYPVSGGASTYRESVPVPDDLREQGERLLAAVGWHGAAMVEFKRSAATGAAYLMEVNGRLWGSLKLAIDAGVDFPALLVEGALGGRTARRQGGKAAPGLGALDPADLPSGGPAVRPPYRTGIRCRWFWGEVNHVLDRILHPDAVLELPPGAPSRLRAVLDFLLWLPWRDRFEVFAWTDPWPWFRESRQWISERVGRVVRKVRGER